jgi:hypothetical protein
MAYLVEKLANCFYAAFATYEKNRGLALPQLGGWQLCDCVVASSGRAVVAKLSTKFATLSIGEIRFNWFNLGKKPVPDE